MYSSSPADGCNECCALTEEPEQDTCGACGRRLVTDSNKSGQKFYLGQNIHFRNKGSCTFQGIIKDIDITEFSHTTIGYIGCCYHAAKYDETVLVNNIGVNVIDLAESMSKRSRSKPLAFSPIEETGGKFIPQKKTIKKSMSSSSSSSSSYSSSSKPLAKLAAKAAPTLTAHKKTMPVTKATVVSMSTAPTGPLHKDRGMNLAMRKVPGNAICGSSSSSSSSRVNQANSSSRSSSSSSSSSGSSSSSSSSVGPRVMHAPPTDRGRGRDTPTDTHRDTPTDTPGQEEGVVWITDAIVGQSWDMGEEHDTGIFSSVLRKWVNLSSPISEYDSVEDLFCRVVLIEGDCAVRRHRGVSRLDRCQQRALLHLLYDGSRGAIDLGSSFAGRAVQLEREASLGAGAGAGAGVGVGPVGANHSLRWNCELSKTEAVSSDLTIPLVERVLWSCPTSIDEFFSMPETKELRTKNSTLPTILVNLITQFLHLRMINPNAKGGFSEVLATNYRRCSDLIIFAPLEYITPSACDLCPDSVSIGRGVAVARCQKAFSDMKPTFPLSYEHFRYD
jgi:hypothetical protein